MELKLNVGYTRWWVGLNKYRAARVVGGNKQVQSYKGGGWG